MHSFYSETLLVEALKNGDERAFDGLYEKYFPKLFQFLRKISRSVETAEDLAHEVFLKVWINRQQLDAGQNFSSYLFTIARHQLLNYVRNQQTGHNYIKTEKPYWPATHNQTEETVINADYQTFYEKALTSLPQQKKTIFLLNRQDGKSYREIARELRLSEKTVEFHMSDSLKMLRKYFRLHTDVACTIAFLFWIVI